MKNFINLKDISSINLKKILADAKNRKKLRKKLSFLDIDNKSPLRGKLLIQMFEKSSLRTRMSFYLAIKQLGGSTLTLRPSSLPSSLLLAKICIPAQTPKTLTFFMKTIS